MSQPSHISIAGREIGPGRPAFIIGEVAQAHDGSLGAAHAYVDAIAAAGAHAIKFQTHIASAESTPGEPWRVKFSKQDATRYDYWRRMEFTPEQWAGLAEHAKERGLVFLSSPFSFAAIELLEKLDMAAWKVASGEVTNLPMVERMAKPGRPVLLSSGMASWSELDAAVEVIRAARAPLAVFQCTTAYPCPPERVGLNVLAELRARYSCPIGLSDHSATIFAGLAAAALGAELLEVHVVFSKECFGPDTKASLTTQELAQLVEGTRFVHAALGARLDKDEVASEMSGLKTTFGKSIVAARAIEAGTVLRRDDLDLRKPGTGLPPSALGQVVGRRARRTIAANSILSTDDLETTS